MEIREINPFKDFSLFQKIRDAIHKHFSESIKPLDSEIRNVFNPQKNKSFQHGHCKAWVASQGKQYVGRIAAFYAKDYFNIDDEQATGGVGFFECIDNQEVANALFDVAKNWLQSEGYEAMDGPINFGNKLQWWGLIVEGANPIPFTLMYYPSYYKRLLETYGFQNFYEQYCFSIDPSTFDVVRFGAIAQRIKKHLQVEVRTFNKKELDAYAHDFCLVYNAAWLKSHGGGHIVEKQEVMTLLKTLMPVLDEDLILFVYHNNQPISFMFSLPELNEYFKHCNGKLGIWQMMKMMYRKTFFPTHKFNGLIYGTTPEFQNKGVETLIYFTLFDVCKKKRYNECELIWVGDFNPKMVSICEKIGFKQSRKLITYRYLFDRKKTFKRHPII